MSDEPCTCHQSVAYVTPTHGGHCCFIPENQTCHAEEVAAWERRAARNRRRMSDEAEPEVDPEFHTLLAEFMDENDEVLRRLAAGPGDTP